MKPVPLLALIALGSALAAAGCFAGMYAVVGANDSGSTEIITREIPWDGSTRLGPTLPSVTRYIQAPGPGKIIARGPHRSVSTLRVTNGRIGDTLLHTGAVIELTITAPNIASFTVEGDSTLTIENFDQPTLTLSATGGAQVTASGRAGNVSVAMEGETIANLSRLDTISLTGALSGLSTVIAAPTQTLDLAIGGGAYAILLTHPPDLHTDITENGRLIDASPS
jgi:putative autotransporter adhesin-like protein